MASLKNILQKIKMELALEQTSLVDQLNADAQQAKQNVRKSIAKLTGELHLREQWLVNHVDETEEYISQLLLSDEAEINKTRGKLESCLELSGVSKFENSNEFLSFASDCLKHYQNLVKRDQHYQPGSLEFRGNEDRLISLIQKYGKLVDSDTQCYGESSEKSWECVGSETTSAAESVDGDKFIEPVCHGLCSTKCFEIEDINKHFDASKLAPLVPQSLQDICKANEVCSSIDDCLFEEPCCARFATDAPPASSYIAAIEEEFKKISQAPMEVESTKMDCDDVEVTVVDPFNFELNVANLEAQFNHIIEETARSNEASAVAYPADSIAREIQNVLNNSSGDSSHQAQCLTVSYPSATSVSNEIDYIIASNIDCEPVFFPDVLSKMIKLNINPFKNPPKELLESCDNLPLVNSAAKYDPGLEFGFETEKHDSEKNVPVHENMYLVAGSNGWSSVGDVHDLLLGIIDSE